MVNNSMNSFCPLSFHISHVNPTTPSVKEFRVCGDRDASTRLHTDHTFTLYCVAMCLLVDLHQIFGIYNNLDIGHNYEVYFGDRKIFTFILILQISYIYIRFYS